MDDTITDFTASELWFLFGQFAPASIIGLADPTVGLLDHEIGELAQLAQEGLLRKEVFRVDDNSLAVCEPYQSIARCITSPLHTFLIMSENADAEQKISSYHFSSKHSAGLHQRTGNSYVLAEMKSVDEIYEFVMDALITAIYLERDEESIQLSGKQLLKVHSYIQKKQKGKAEHLLGGLFDLAEQRERFLMAISEPLVRMSFMSFLNRHDPSKTRSEGFSLIAGEQDIWLFTPESEDYDLLKARSVTKMELEETIRKFLPSMEFYHE